MHMRQGVVLASGYRFWAIRLRQKARVIDGIYEWAVLFMEYMETAMTGP